MQTVKIEELPELMEQQDVCRLLHIHPNTFRALCINGKLPAVKVGRRWYVRKAELLEMLGYRRDGQWS